MELGLNLAWVAVCIVALAATLPMVRRSRRPLILGLALICALALLFPIISVSDDLASDFSTFEESAIRRISAVSHQTDTPFVAIVVTLILSILLTAVALVETRVMPRQQLLLVRHTDPRSPPRR